MAFVGSIGMSFNCGRLSSYLPLFLSCCLSWLSPCLDACQHACLSAKFGMRFSIYRTQIKLIFLFRCHAQSQRKSAFISVAIWNFRSLGALVFYRLLIHLWIYPSVWVSQYLHLHFCACISLFASLFISLYRYNFIYEQLRFSMNISLSFPKYLFNCNRIRLRYELYLYLFSS